jgi:deoxyribodipyrimidine photolyase
MRTLVWITHSFRVDSRLTAALKGECAFVYYSPYYFAGKRELKIYDSCSQENLDAFYQSINYFDLNLQKRGARLSIFKSIDPIKHINQLCDAEGFDQVIIDQPLFAMWHSIDLLQLNRPWTFIDSALIDDGCRNMTAKSRWMSHVRKISEYKPHRWNSEIIPITINQSEKSYPKVRSQSKLMDQEYIVDRAKRISPTYGQTRDHHDGQTHVSIALHNGIIDPHNLFYELAKQFQSAGANMSVNEGAHASMLRQFAFRELNIIKARQNGLTLENTPEEWARALMTPTNFEHLVSAKPKPESNLTFEQIRTATTGIQELDTILRHFLETGHMPNRARMYFAGRIFYESRTGEEALRFLIDTFDLLGLDGQSPNNYLQCCSSLTLQYGRVMLLNANRTFELLQYNVNK